jgi:hypothetical protein
MPTWPNFTLSNKRAQDVEKEHVWQAALQQLETMEGGDDSGGGGGEGGDSGRGGGGESGGGSAAVILAPIAYIKVVAVKKLVVEVLNWLVYFKHNYNQPSIPMYFKHNNNWRATASESRLWGPVECHPSF